MLLAALQLLLILLDVVLHLLALVPVLLLLLLLLLLSDEPGLMLLLLMLLLLLLVVVVVVVPGERLALRVEVAEELLLLERIAPLRLLVVLDLQLSRRHVLREGERKPGELQPQLPARRCPRHRRGGSDRLHVAGVLEVLAEVRHDRVLAGAE